MLNRRWPYIQKVDMKLGFWCNFHKTLCWPTCPSLMTIGLLRDCEIFANLRLTFVWTGDCGWGLKQSWIFEARRAQSGCGIGSICLEGGGGGLAYDTKYNFLPQLWSHKTYRCLDKVFNMKRKLLHILCSVFFLLKVLILWTSKTQNAYNTFLSNS